MIIMDKLSDAIQVSDTYDSLNRHSPRRPIGKYLRGAMRPHYPMPSIYCCSLISRKVDERAWIMSMIDILWRGPC